MFSVSGLFQRTVSVRMTKKRTIDTFNKYSFPWMIPTLAALPVKKVVNNKSTNDREIGHILTGIRMGL